MRVILKQGGVAPREGNADATLRSNLNKTPSLTISSTIATAVASAGDFLRAHPVRGNTFRVVTSKRSAVYSRSRYINTPR